MAEAAAANIDELSLEQAVQQLASGLGPRLQAIYSFGTDFARGQRGGRGRLLVLVDQADVACLDPIVALITRCQASAIKVRVDTVRNLVNGADAFPAFTLELRDNRKLLSGADVLANLQLDNRYLRLHIEHGLRSMHRELIDFYLDRDIRGYQLPGLRKMLRKLAYLLEGALICKGEAPPEGTKPERVLELAKQSLLPDLSNETWSTISQFATGEVALGPQQAPRLYASLLEALPAVIAVVDKMPDA